MKFIRRDYTAFVGIPNTRAGIQDFMCSEIADMIVSSDTGWEYDTRTPNKEAFIRIPLSGYTGDTIKPTPVLYLRNSVSGCKMMVCNIMFHAEGSAININEQPISQNIIAKGEVTNSNYASGIGISMIPPDVSDEYPDEYTEETTFGDSSLLVMTEAAASISGDNSSANFEGYEQKLFGVAGTPVVSYGVLVDQYCITLFGGFGNTTRGQVKPIFTTGKVLGTLAYDTEIAMQSYGSIRYFSVQGGSATLYDSSIDYSQSIQNSNGGLEKAYYGAYSNYYSSYPSKFYYACTQFFKQDGARYNYGYYGIGCNEMLSARITNSQTPDFIRWSPGIMFASKATIYEGGDGFKGYLDTNLIRYAIANKGQLFNNGQFCCVADNLLLKWDPDATDTILA